MTYFEKQRTKTLFASISTMLLIMGGLAYLDESFMTFLMAAGMMSGALLGVCGIVWFWSKVFNT